MVRGNDRQHGIFEIKRLEPLFAQIQTYDWGRVGGSEKNKFINHKLGLEVRVGRQSVITKHDCQQLPFQQSWWKKTSNSPALYSSTFCYLAQGIVIFFSYIYKIKRWWGPITLQGNAGRVINVGLESFTSNQNLKFPVMCRWQEGSRRLLVMEQGQFLFGGVLTILGCHALIPCFLIILSRGQAGPKHGPMRRDRSRLLGWRWALRKQSLQVNNDTSLYLHNASKFTKCFHVQYFTECSNNSIRQVQQILFSPIYKWENWDSKAPKSLSITLLFFWSLNPYSNMLSLLRDTPQAFQFLKTKRNFWSHAVSDLPSSLFQVFKPENPGVSFPSPSPSISK